MDTDARDLAPAAARDDDVGVATVVVEHLQLSGGRVVGQRRTRAARENGGDEGGGLRDGGVADGVDAAVDGV